MGKLKTLLVFVLDPTGLWVYRLCCSCASPFVCTIFEKLNCNTLELGFIYASLGENKIRENGDDDN